MTRRAALTAAAVLALLTTGCSDDPTPEPSPVAETPHPVAPYDATQEPALAVLPLIPAGTVAVTVTNLERAREDQARPRLTGALPPGVARGQLAWAAHFYDAQGAETGYVLAPTTGASAGELLTSGTAAEPQESLAAELAADIDVADLVGEPAQATYLGVGCTPGLPQGEERLQELAAYSVQLEGGLVTARLGADRDDLFARLRLAKAAGAGALSGGVADPATGRLGFVLERPRAAERLITVRRLPFVACATDG